MKNLNYIYNTFTAQTDPNGCGKACMSMILNYAGIFDQAETVNALFARQQNADSLLKLRNLALSAGLNARCVHMDLQTLRSLQAPVILLILNRHNENHFIVCFGATKTKAGYRYLVGDPASQVHNIMESELLSVWIDHAAIYFENLKLIKPGYLWHPWLALTKISSFKKTLLVSVPFLHICSTLLGITLSWMLQRGIDDSLTDKKSRLVVAVIVLLFLLTIFKSVVNFVRQHVLITLNNAVKTQLTEKFIQSTLNKLRSWGEQEIKRGFNDIQKIQDAVTVFVSVLISDGCIISLVLAGLVFFEPIAGLMNCVYITLTIIIGIRTSRMQTYKQAEIMDLQTKQENDLIFLCNNFENLSYHVEHVSKQLNSEGNYKAMAKALSSTITRLNFLYECLGAINVISVFIFCLYQIFNLRISYNMLITEVILTYFITVLMPRLCAVFPVISEGARLARKYQ